MYSPSNGKYKSLLLLVGVCLIGTAFHVHQLLPDYELHHYDLEHHFTTDLPDCFACLHLVHGMVSGLDFARPAYFATHFLIRLQDRVPVEQDTSQLKNKSPPPDITAPI